MPIQLRDPDGHANDGTPLWRCSGPCGHLNRSRNLASANVMIYIPAKTST